MTRDEIAAWVSSRRDTLNRRDAAGLTRLFAADCVVESPTAGGTVRGLTAIDAIHRAWASGFPDVTFTTNDLMIDDDRAAWIVTATGTDSGGFMGLPPTGKVFELPMALFTTLRDGLITSERRIYDFTDLLMQVGILKVRATDPMTPVVKTQTSSVAVADGDTSRATVDREAISGMLALRQRAWAERNVRTLADQHAPDAVMDSHLAGRVAGLSAIADVYAAWFAAFPDSEIRTEEVIVDGSHVAELVTMTGTDTGGFLGRPPTGKPFRLPSAWLYTLRDGRFVYVRPVYDFTGMLVQIRALKAKPQ